MRVITETERVFDFRVGGCERLFGKWISDAVSMFDCHYQDIVPINDESAYTGDRQALHDAYAAQLHIPISDPHEVQAAESRPSALMSAASSTALGAP